jgi:thioredoxin reductase
VITSAAFENIPLFAGVEEQEQRRLARRAADIHLERDANDYICTGRDIQTWPLDREPFALETSIPGIFCAGDVRHGSVKRVASSVGEGSMSIAFIHEYLAFTDAGTQVS